MAYILTYTDSGTTPDIIVGDDGSQTTAAERAANPPWMTGASGINYSDVNQGMLDSLNIGTGSNLTDYFSDGSADGQLSGYDLSADGALSFAPEVGYAMATLGYTPSTDGSGSYVNSTTGQVVAPSQVSSALSSGSSTGGSLQQQLETAFASMPMGGGGSSGGGGGGSNTTGMDTPAYLGTQPNTADSGLFSSRNGGTAAPIQTSAGNTTVPVYGPTPAAYNQAMNAALPVLSQGMSNVYGTLNNAQNANSALYNNVANNATNTYNTGQTELANAFNQAGNTLTGSINQGATSLSNALQQAIGQYNPITGQAANDYQNLKNITNGSFNQDFQDYTNSQAYQFPLQQQLAAVQGSAAAKGTLHSSADLKNLNNYAGNYASQQYNQYQQQRTQNAQNLANTSLGAMQQQAGLQSTLGQQLAGLYSTQGQVGSNLSAQYGTNAIGQRANQASTIANLSNNTSNNAAALSQSLAQAYGQNATTTAQTLTNGILGRGQNSIQITV